MLRTLILFFAMTLATMSMAADDRYDSLMKAAVDKPSVQILEDAAKRKGNQQPSSILEILPGFRWFLS